MRRVGEMLARPVSGRDSVVPQPVMELLFRSLFNGRSRIARRLQPQQSPPRAFHRRRMRLDFHPVEQRRVTGCGVTVPTFHRDHAQPAGAARMQPVVMAKRRHIRALRAQGVENRRALGCLARPAIDR